jgi:hypothetical protein
VNPLVLTTPPTTSASMPSNVTVAPVPAGRATFTPASATALAVSTLGVTQESPKKKLDLSGTKITSSAVHSFMRTKIAEETGYLLVVSGTGPVQVGNKTKAIMVIAMVDKMDKMNWSFKAGPFIGTVNLVANHIPQCQHLQSVTSNMHAVTVRRDQYGANIGACIICRKKQFVHIIEAILTIFLYFIIDTGESQRGKRGGEFPVEILCCLVDLTDKLRGSKTHLNCRRYP